MAVDRRNVVAPQPAKGADISSPQSATVSAVVGQVPEGALAVRYTLIYQAQINTLDGSLSSHTATDVVVVPVAR